MEAAPNEWSILKELVSSLTTLAVALLGVTVTFSDKIVGEAVSPMATNALTWLLIAIVVTIIFGVLSLAFIANYLRKGTRDKAAVLCANVSFFTLVAAGGLLAWLGWMKFRSDRKTPAEEATRIATEGAARSLSPTAGWAMDSLEWSAADTTYRIYLQSGVGRASVVVGRTEPRVRAIKRWK